MSVLECVSLPPANKKLSDITAELSKAQEHARRFQELLMTERRKEKSLKVTKHFNITVRIILLSISLHKACSGAGAEQEGGWAGGGAKWGRTAGLCRHSDRNSQPPQQEPWTNQS